VKFVPQVPSVETGFVAVDVDEVDVFVDVDDFVVEEVDDLELDEAVEDLEDVDDILDDFEVLVDFWVVDEELEDATPQVPKLELQPVEQYELVEPQYPYCEQQFP
jgi:hypothetical protein